MTTSLRTALDRLLGDQTLDEFVAERRPHTAWRHISRQLEDATGVDVSPQTLLNWFGENVEAAS